MKELDRFYDLLEEPQKSCFLSLRDSILNFHKDMTEEWKYRLPFFYLKQKPFCYLWKDKTTKTPYLGFPKGNLIEHPLLIKGERKKMKVLYIDPLENIPVKSIEEILKTFLPLYSTK